MPTDGDLATVTGGHSDKSQGGESIAEHGIKHHAAYGFFAPAITAAGSRLEY
jgi:hypothetical protein